ncbi:MAG: hypothetical protein CM1200mP2_32510 [Planctomycetaceae bacterium]|nr:MAG: hypothetical protein CM1200mP2_32510 [Planctomycetaceae bacterium]
MVDSPVGDLIHERVRAMGVRPFYKMFEHDGVRGPNMATVYSDQGAGVRAPVVFYNRANEAAALLGPGDFDWASITSGGVRWFHSGGIFAALAATTPEVIIEGMQAAKAAGAIVSFDLNFRAKLWEIAGGLETAQETMRRIVEHVDVLVGNEEDLQMGLGLTGPDVESSGKLDPSAFFAMMGAGGRIPAVGKRWLPPRFERFIRPIATSGARCAGSREGTFRAPTCELDVVDRVGGGGRLRVGVFFRALFERT